MTSGRAADVSRSLLAIGLGSGIALAAGFTASVVIDLWVPGAATHRLWERLLPGFAWLTWPSFFLGLAESFAYGLVAALFLSPLYTHLATQRRRLRKTQAKE